MFRDRFFGGAHHFGGPWQGGSWRESPFQKGDLKYVVLGLLKDKPRYGYEIIRALEERSHGFYTPSPGVVYPTLQMLEEMGYASAEERDGKKVYTITDEGLKFLAERKDQAEEVKCQMKHQANWENL
jgi:DNA-binding PadR family transcriptional regulator